MMNDKRNNFNQQVSEETATLFMGLFFAPASLYLTRLGQLDFWHNPLAILRWVTLVGAVYGVVYAGIFLCANIAPYWWGSEAKQTYGHAMMSVATQHVVVWVTSPFYVFCQSVSLWLDTKMSHYQNQTQQIWRVAHTPCCPTSRPFSLFGRAPLIIP